MYGYNYLMSQQQAFVPSDCGSSLRLWLKASDLSKVTKGYVNFVATATGTSGASSFTASGSLATSAFPGSKLRLNGTDVYDVISVTGGGTTINISGTLSTNYVAAAIAIEKVSQIIDKSGYAHVLTQATASRQPSYKYAFGSTPASFFGDNGDDMTCATASLMVIPAGANTEYAVANTLVDAAGADYVWHFSEVASGRHYLQFTNVANRLIYQSRASDANGVQFNGTDQTVKKIVRTRRVGTAQFIAVDNSAESTNAFGQDETGCDLFSLFSRATIDSFFNGHLHELVMLDQNAPPGMHRLMEQYLAKENSVTLLP